MKPALVILAAGASSRLASCKALVPITPRHPLELLADAGSTFDGAPTLVVTGPDHALIWRALERAGRDTGSRSSRVFDRRDERRAGPRAERTADHDTRGAVPRSFELRDLAIAFNARSRLGRTGSVALAAHLRRGLDLCLAPVDVPLVPRAVFEALAQAWVSAGSPARGWLAPRYQGRYGHPVVVGRALLEELAGFEAGTPLTSLRQRADPCFGVDVEAPEIHDDLDTSDQLAALRARFSH